jgi:hypothetical protein
MINDSFRILDWQANARISRGEAPAVLGFIPGFVSEDDPRPVHEQFDEHYIGGWDPMLPSAKGWKLDQNNYLHYPGDPPLAPLAHAYCRDELILVYHPAFVCIVQRDGSFSVARMD